MRLQAAFFIQRNFFPLFRFKSEKSEVCMGNCICKHSRVKMADFGVFCLECGAILMKFPMCAHKTLKSRNSFVCCTECGEVLYEEHNM